jgi:phosphoglycolate phosphatase-like HAD superfamily hydrolase
MPYKAIVSDWNGTLTSTSEEALNKRIGYTAFGDTKREVYHGHVEKLPALGKLIVAKILTERNLRDYKRGKRHLRDVYKAFNFGLRGQSAEYINRIVDEFASQTSGLVDERILRPIKDVHLQGKFTGILSVAYERIIKRSLEEAGYPDVFDDIVANTLQTDGDKVIGLTLEIYERKPEVLRTEFFEKGGLRENDTLYLGDSEDDEPIAEILIPGNFIVPFLATDEFKQRVSSKHKAFVPENEEDLLKYLKSR